MRRFCVFELGCVAWGVGGVVVGLVFVHRLHLVRRFCVFEPGCVAWGVAGVVVGLVLCTGCAWCDGLACSSPVVSRQVQCVRGPRRWEAERRVSGFLCVRL